MSRIGRVQAQPVGSSGAAGPPVTILFTDLEGSTAMQSLRGDAAANEVVQHAEQLARSHVAAIGGRVVKSTGDGLMVAFGSPRAAVACALAIMADLAELAERSPHLACRLRAGVHTGEVIDTGDDFHGATVSAAARICAAAEGGEVLVSNVVRQLCGTVAEVTFTSRGRFTLKGFAEPWLLFAANAGTEAEEGSAAPFVGRSSERAELRELLQRTAAGHGAFVLIGGEPGVGKTSLVIRMADEARQRGFGVLIGHCYQRRIDVPYAPWVEMIVAAARYAGPDRLRSLIGSHASALAELAPEIRDVLPDVPPLADMPAPQRRNYLFEGLRAWIAAGAAGRPFILFVDDLHWADASTLVLCTELAEWVESLPVLVVATYRDPPSERSAQLDETLAALVLRRTVWLMSLASHDRDDVADIIFAVTGESPPPDVVDALHDCTEGNAFFLLEMLRYLADSGRLFDERGRFRPGSELDSSDVPSTARLVISQRLARIDDQTQRLLVAAAVLGRRFEIAELAGMAELAENAVLDGLEEAERASMVLEERDGTEAYRFTHELFRQTLLSGLSAARRRRYHQRAAEVLERLHADGVGVPVARIAGHLLQAQNADPLRTARYLRLTGERAQRASAHEEALRSFRDALAILPPDHPQERADLLLGLGAAQRSLGQWDEAIGVWDEGLRLLEALGDTDRAGVLCWEFTRQLTWAYRFEELAAVARRGLAVVGDRSDPHRARLLVMRALALGFARQPEAAFAHAEEAKQLAAASDDPSAVDDVWTTVSVLHYFFMQLPQTEQAARPAAERLREADALWTLADLLSFLDASLVYRGRLAEATEVNAELLPLAEKLGHWGAGSAARRNRFAAGSAEGDLMLLETLAREQLKSARATGHPGWVGASLSLSAVVEFWQGKWPQAFHLVQEALQLTSPFWLGREQGLLLMFHAFCGEAELVHTRLAEFEPSLPTPGRPNLLGQWSLALFAGEAVGLVGGADRARSLYRMAVEAMATGTVLRQLDGRLVEISAALTAAAADLDEQAESHFESALTQADGLPQVMDQPYVRHLFARFLIARAGSGDRDRANELLEAALPVYRTLGMPRHEAMAMELRRRL